MNEEREERKIAQVVCPQCKREFTLCWNDYSVITDGKYKETLVLRGCPSGGIYDVTIKCPFCDYSEAL
jgi:RNA polymerase subunit RPABC4/transcription elongation factor Spt4